jgi:hypothetical protein
MELPKTIVIGSLHYAVKFREMDGRYGHCDCAKLELVLNTDTIVERQAKTLVHEMMHAWCYENGLDNWADEKLIVTLENNFYQLLRDNDFSWIRVDKDADQQTN